MMYDAKTWILTMVLVYEFEVTQGAKARAKRMAFLLGKDRLENEVILPRTNVTQDIALKIIKQK